MALPATALSMPILGEIGIGGSLSPTCSGMESADCTMDLADGVTFVNSGGGNQFLVTFSDGHFAAEGVGFGDRGTIHDFMFSPAPTPLDPLWEIGDFRFRLDTLVILQQTESFLELMGSGLVMHPGYEDSPGRWTLSTDSADEDLTFSWSSTTVASEPGILVLMGMGLIGLFGSRRLVHA